MTHFVENDEWFSGSSFVTKTIDEALFKFYIIVLILLNTHRKLRKEYCVTPAVYLSQDNSIL